MKDKDPNEEEFNQDDQDNINEADDSFGLPDLDFTTLDDESDAEEESVEEPESDQPEEEIVNEVESATEEEFSVDETVETEEPAEEVAEETIVAAYDDSSDDSNGDDGSDDGGSGDDGDDDAEDSGSGYVPPAPESNAPRIIIALLVTVIVSGAIWYFAFYRPQKAAEEKARQEQLAKDEAAKAAAAKKKAEAERLAAEQKANEAADADEAASKEAIFSTISEPTGRYYIVVASFIDVDMAVDLGEKLKGDGVSSTLLSPQGNRKFNRLTLGDFGSWNEAQEEANKLKGEYGDGLWVLKF